MSIKMESDMVEFTNNLTLFEEYLTKEDLIRIASLFGDNLLKLEANKPTYSNEMEAEIMSIIAPAVKKWKEAQCNK